MVGCVARPRWVPRSRRRVLTIRRTQNQGHLIRRISYECPPLAPGDRFWALFTPSDLVVLKPISRVPVPRSPVIAVSP